MDQRIEVFDTSRHDVNGKRGVATDFSHVLGMDGNCTSQSRYTVRLDSGEKFKVGPNHVRAEPAAQPGARPKVKGKGKKGRGKRGK